MLLALPVLRFDSQRGFQNTYLKNDAVEFQNHEIPLTNHLTCQRAVRRSSGRPLLRTAFPWRSLSVCHGHCGEIREFIHIPLKSAPPQNTRAGPTTAIRRCRSEARRLERVAVTEQQRLAALNVDAQDVDCSHFHRD